MNTKLHPMYIYLFQWDIFAASTPCLFRLWLVPPSSQHLVLSMSHFFSFLSSFLACPCSGPFFHLLQFEWEMCSLSFSSNFVIYFHKNRVWHLHSSWLKLESATAVAKWKQQNAENMHTHTMRVKKKRIIFSIWKVGGGWERDGILSTMEFISEKSGQGTCSSNSGSSTTANYHVWGYIY